MACSWPQSKSASLKAVPVCGIACLDISGLMPEPPTWYQLQTSHCLVVVSLRNLHQLADCLCSYQAQELPYPMREDDISMGEVVRYQLYHFHWCRRTLFCPASPSSLHLHCLSYHMDRSSIHPIPLKQPLLCHTSHSGDPNLCNLPSLLWNLETRHNFLWLGQIPLVSGQFCLTKILLPSHLVKYHYKEVLFWLCIWPLTNVRWLQFYAWSSFLAGPFPIRIHEVQEPVEQSFIPIQTSFSNTVWWAGPQMSQATWFTAANCTEVG